MKKLLVVLMFALTVSAYAADTERYAVVVTSPEYSTDILAINPQGDDQLTIRVSEPACSWSYKKSVTENGSLLIDDAGGLLCQDGFNVVKVSSANPLIATESLVTYSGSTNNAFSVPGLSLAMQDGAKATLRGVQSTVDRQAFLSIWNLGTKNANLTIRVTDGNGASIGTETVVLSLGFNYYILNTPFETGTVVLSQELAGWGFPTNEPLVGFLANNIDANGAPRIVPIQ